MIQPGVVGRVRELRRYPVKSLLGERLEAASLTSAGLAGDRLWAVRDAATGRLLSAKRVPALLGCAARLRDGSVELVWPDGTRARHDDRNVAGRLSAVVGREVELVARRADLLPTFEGADPEGRTEVFTGPPGTFFDSAPLHVLTDATLRALEAEHAPAGDLRRFRPNIVVEVGGELDGFVENHWIGLALAFGDRARARINKSCARCVLVTHGQEELPADRAVLRTVTRVNDNVAGVLATVAVPGPVRVGDEVRVV
jgi:uncharacterized protein YcbX